MHMILKWIDENHWWYRMQPFYHASSSNLTLRPIISMHNKKNWFNPWEFVVFYITSIIADVLDMEVTQFD